MNFLKDIQTFALTGALVIGTAGLAVAQTPAPSAGSTIGGPTTTRTDDRHDWGWVGLIGLLGLAGLMGRRRNTGVAHTTGTTGPTGTTGSRM